MMFSLMGALTSSSSLAEHSLLYNETPTGWASERKFYGLPLWWIGTIDNGHWCVYSSRQWFRMGQSDVFPFTVSVGKVLFAVEDF